MCPWISTSCVALAAKAVRWRIEQDEEFREEVEHYTDAGRVVLADAYQALLSHGPLPHPSSPLAIHQFRDPRAQVHRVKGARARHPRPTQLHRVDIGPQLTVGRHADQAAKTTPSRAGAQVLHPDPDS